MADGPKPCRKCGHDKATHYTRARYDFERQKVVHETECCLARACECPMYEEESGR